MTSAIVNLTEKNSMYLNILKAYFGLKNKSDAMNFIVSEYAKEVLEPQLRPEYAKKLQKIMKEKGNSYKSLAKMKEAYS